MVDIFGYWATDNGCLGAAPKQSKLKKNAQKLTRRCASFTFETVETVETVATVETVDCGDGGD